MKTFGAMTLVEVVCEDQTCANWTYNKACTLNSIVIGVETFYGKDTAHDHNFTVCKMYEVG
jgi:hypothetical protein